MTQNNAMGPLASLGPATTGPLTLRKAGVIWRFEDLLQKKPMFCRIVMTEKRITSPLREFQQYLMSQGFEITDDPLAITKQKKISKASALAHDDLVRKGQYKGKSFSYVYEIDCAYCKTILKKTDVNYLEFRNWLQRIGLRLDPQVNPYQRLDNKYKYK